MHVGDYTYPGVQLAVWNRFRHRYFHANFKNYPSRGTTNQLPVQLSRPLRRNTSLILIVECYLMMPHNL